MRNSYCRADIGHHSYRVFGTQGYMERIDRFGKPAPISLKEGLAMTLPGIYAEESSERGGEVMRMYYPWDPEWTGEF